MKKPLIGVVPLMDYDKDSYWMLPGYMKGIEEAGGIPLMLPLTDDCSAIEQLAELCDGFLLTGGHDVSPELYGEKILKECGEICPERDIMEKHLLELALDADKAVLGICRGIQFINAVLGGSLYQDLPTQHESSTKHVQKPPYDVPVHKVNVCEKSPLYELLGKEKLDVNSYHHQAVKELSPELEAMAYSEDGLVEAVCMPEKNFIWAVQWHPEFSYKVNEDSKKIFSAFVSAAVH